jgi:hypothetical protein
MIRKWSYLTTTKGFLVNKSLSELTKCYSFKVFRMTTRFKKYQRYGTSFVRKQDSSRKRQTSWLTLLSIFAQWALQYIKYRQYLRYYQSVNLHKYQFTIPNIFVIAKKLNQFNPMFSFTTSTITTQLLNSLHNTKVNINTRVTHLNILSSDTNSPQTLKEVNVSGYVYDKQTFTEFESLHTLQQRTIETLYKSCYQNSLNQVVELYKIITLLSLYKVNINYEFR